MASIRLRRVESLLREEISSLILRHEIKDPRVDSMLSVTNVEVSKDLAYAKVRVSSFKEQGSLESAVEGLNSAAGFIQSKLGKRLRFKSTPILTFLADHSIQQGFEVNQTIDRVAPKR